MNQVLLQFGIYGYSVHKIFRHKAQHADNGYSLGKCCNAVTGHLVIALRVSFSALLARQVSLTMVIPLSRDLPSNTASDAEKLTVSANIKLKEY
jgi:hypothetical protein